MTKLILPLLLICWLTPSIGCKSPSKSKASLQSIAAEQALPMISQKPHNRKLAAADTNKLTLLAEQGDAGAQYYLADSYVKKDMKTAAKWYREAASQGHVLSQTKLGTQLFLGRGVEQDVKEGVKWLREAAEQGQAQAQFFVGHAYEAGEGVLENYEQAAKWFHKSARQGMPLSQWKIGSYYTVGRGGLDRDLIIAYAWITLASSNGLDPDTDRLANKAKGLIKEELNTKKIARAQKLMRQMVKLNPKLIND